MADDRDYDRGYRRDDRRHNRSRSAVVYDSDDDYDRPQRRRYDDRDYANNRRDTQNNQLVVRDDGDRSRSAERYDDRRDLRRSDFRDLRASDMVVYEEDRRALQRYDDRDHRRRHRHHSRRSDSDDDSDDSKHRSRSKNKNEKEKEKEEAKGRCWYSGKERKDASFAERNFDSSYDGIIAAVAGAALGSMTMRRFGGEENKDKKVFGAAVVGAATFNMAENWYRIYTEEEEEIKDRVKRKVKNKLRV